MPALDFNSLEHPRMMLRPYGPISRRRNASVTGERMRYASMPVDLRDKAGAPGVLVTLPSNQSPSPSRGYARVNALGGMGQLRPMRFPEGARRPSLRGMGVEPASSSGYDGPRGKDAFWAFLDNAMAWADRNTWIAGAMVVAGSLVSLRMFGVLDKLATAAGSSK